MTRNRLPVFSDGATPGENDIVIALMGMTGSGKSSIINLCTDQDIEIGHELGSCTQDVETYVFHYPTLRSGRVYLVDTPGFDDTNRKDTEVLRTLGAWLTATYSGGIKLSGIIYCHRINQTRMQGSAIKNIQLLRSLCGDDALSKVVLVTTMWDIENRDIAERREKELKDTTKYRGNMIAKGSLVLRHYNTQQSALALVDTFVKDNAKVVLGIQKEMVNGQKPLDKTEAGHDIKGMLDEQNASLRSEIHTVESDLREALRAKDEELAEVMRELRLEHKQALQQVLDNQQRLQATMQQLHESKSVELEAKLGKGRREWQSKILSQSPYRVPGSSATNAQRPAKAYQSPKTPSPHPPGNVKMVHLFEREVSVKNRIRCIRISPDGSCFTLFDGSGTVLIATDTGKDLNHYGNSLRPVGFSSGGGILALWDGEFLHKALLDRSTGRRYLRQWQRLNIRKPWTAISEDFETVVDTLEERLALTSLATGKSYKLEWTTESSEMGARGLKFCFAKHDELLVCCGRQSLYFFETRTRRLLRMERILGLATHGAEEKTGDYTYALSGDTLSLGVIAFPFRDVSDTDTVFVSFFRLSGMCPELMSTFQHPCGWRQRLSLSFDGRYIALPNSAESRFDIAHTMSGRIVLSQEVDGELLDLRFFPSDNRFMWLTKKGSYHVARLID